MQRSSTLDIIAEENRNEKLIRTDRKGKNTASWSEVMGHDFTGRWLGECHAIGWRSYVLPCIIYGELRRMSTRCCGRGRGWRRLTGKGKGNREGWLDT